MRLLLLLLLSFSAQAQWVPYADVWYQTGRQVSIQADRDGLPDWLSFDRIDSYGNSGDKVAKYGQAYKWGGAAVWSGVFETQCIGLVGNCWGTETSIGVNGPADPFRGLRIGAGIVINSTNKNLHGEADYGLWVLPFYVDSGRVSVRYGVRVDVPCSIACFSMPSGESLQLSDDPQVGRLRFDPVTGYAGFWRADGLLIWGVNQTNGDERKMWRP
jgi:hypothetical protein